MTRAPMPARQLRALMYALVGVAAGVLRLRDLQLRTGFSRQRARSQRGPGPVPRAGDERVHLNLWLTNGLAPASGAPTEIVLSSFIYTP